MKNKINLITRVKKAVTKRSGLICQADSLDRVTAKRQKQIRVWSFTSFSLLCFINCASAAGAGSATADFLNIGVGAKAAALGGAMTAGAEGTDAMYWNPAGLSELKLAEAAFSHTIWTLGTSHMSAGYAIPLKGQAAIGVLLNYFSSGDIPKVDNTGLSTGNFSASDLSAAFCFSKKIIDSMAVGFNLKLISSSIDDTSGSAFAADLGLKYILSRSIILGAGVFNLGTNLKHILVDEALPMNIKAGILMKLADVSLSADLILPSAGSFGLSTGAEYLLPLGEDISIAARAGYSTAVSAGGLASGIGFVIGGINLDYAFLMFGDLGNNHRFSIKIKL